MYSVTPHGNAWVITIPKGSFIVLEDSKQLQAIAVNEINERGEVLGRVALVSEAYLAERDQREVVLLKEIEKLKLLNK